MFGCSSLWAAYGLHMTIATAPKTAPRARLLRNFLYRRWYRYEGAKASPHTSMRRMWRHERKAASSRPAASAQGVATPRQTWRMASQTEDQVLEPTCDTHTHTHRPMPHTITPPHRHTVTSLHRHTAAQTRKHTPWRALNTELSWSSTSALRDVTLICPRTRLLA